VNSLLKTVTRQRRDCDLNPGPTAPESSTLTTRLPSQRRALSSKPVGRRFCRRSVEQTERRMDRWTDDRRTPDRYIDPAAHTMPAVSATDHCVLSPSLIQHRSVTAKTAGPKIQRSNHLSQRFLFQKPSYIPAHFRHRPVVRS